jgi:hypothetical protein
VSTKNPQDIFPAYIYMVVPFDEIRNKINEKEDAVEISIYSLF